MLLQTILEMNFITHFILGLLIGYVSLIQPGMINMTTVRTTLQHGKKNAIKFAFGASLIVLVQASIALIFTEYFTNHPEVIDGLSLVGGIVFFLLAAFFFYQARKPFKAEGKDKKSGFVTMGIFMSSINMLAIPFYLGMATYLSFKGYLLLRQPFISLFVVGAATGAFLLFYTYTSFAKIIEQRAQFIASNINYILSGLFLILGIMVFIQKVF